jgi:hypothetical protein
MSATAQIVLTPQAVRPGEAVNVEVIGYELGDETVPISRVTLVRPIVWTTNPGEGSVVPRTGEKATFVSTGLNPGTYPIRVEFDCTVVDVDDHDEDAGDGEEDAGDGDEVIEVRGSATIAVLGERPSAQAGSPLSVRLERSLAGETPEETLWRVIDDRTDAIGFPEYQGFMDKVVCAEKQPKISKRWGFDYRSRVDAYRFVRKATEEYLRFQGGLLPAPEEDNPKRTPAALTKLLKSGVLPSERDVEQLRDEYLRQLEPDGEHFLPYYLTVIRAGLQGIDVKPAEALPGPGCYGISGEAMARPCMIELVWSYWMEQGMLVQTMAALGNRFQNRAGVRRPDPLANLALDPLRPAANLFWGYLQTEHERLSLRRRAYEYLQHYGLTLTGKAVPAMQPVETRSRFLEAFHTLLHVTSRFYKQDDDTTVSADAFPVLNALRDLHLVLAEGAHNQYGDLPWTARVEMMTEQWILARPEVREFLGHRAMVPYPEAWMPRVDAMRSLQGWGDTSIRHFRELAVSGEKLLLTVRFGDWSGASGITSAASWARHWRERVYDYVHSYRAVTGVDLTLDQVATRLARDLFDQPSARIEKRRSPAAAGS